MINSMHIGIHSSGRDITIGFSNGNITLDLGNLDFRIFLELADSDESLALDVRDSDTDLILILELELSEIDLSIDFSECVRLNCADTSERRKSYLLFAVVNSP